MRTRPMVAVSQVGEWVGLEMPQGLPRLPALWASLPLDEGSSATPSRSNSPRCAAELALWAPPKSPRQAAGPSPFRQRPVAQTALASLKELALWAPPKGAVPAGPRACPPTPLLFARFDGFWTPVRIAHLPMQYNALVNQTNGVGGRVRIASRIEAARRGECRREPCAVPATVRRLRSPEHRGGPSRSRITYLPNSPGKDGSTCCALI